MSEEKPKYLVGISENTTAPVIDPYFAQQQYAQKMREALESFVEAWESCARWPDTSSSIGRIGLAFKKAEEALAQQPAAGVELTDDDVIRFAQTVKFKGRFVEAMLEVLAFAKQSGGVA